MRFRCRVLPGGFPGMVTALETAGDLNEYTWVSLRTVVEIGHYRAGLEAVEQAVATGRDPATAPRMAEAILDGLRAFADLRQRYYGAVFAATARWRPMAATRETLCHAEQLDRARREPPGASRGDRSGTGPCHLVRAGAARRSLCQIVAFKAGAAAEVIVRHETGRLSFPPDALAGMKAGERVLIHAASGGVGQAALRLALMVGAEIFATTSPEKWPALRAMGVRHLFHSRTLDFRDDILRATDGLGVDIVLISLGREAQLASFDVAAVGGRFVEIGKLGILRRSRRSGARDGAASGGHGLRAAAADGPKRPAGIGRNGDRRKARSQAAKMKSLPPTPDLDSVRLTPSRSGFCKFERAIHV